MSKYQIDEPATGISLENAQEASDEWGFNCGPGALCAVLGMTPDSIRPHLLDFEIKGYTNPTLMANILHGLHVRFRRKYECAVQVDGRPLKGDWPRFGLVRIQWGGPWTKEGVPMRARYRQTHWVASRAVDATAWRSDARPMPQPIWPGHEIFDVNALCVGGWLPYDEWAGELVPWLLKQAVPKASGEWWPTHCWEIEK